MADEENDYAFNDSITEGVVTGIKAAVADGDFDALNVLEPLHVADDHLAEFTTARLTGASLDIAGKYRTKILGVDFPAVATALLTALTVARATKYYKDIFTDLTIAVAAAYTVSRDVSVDYGRIGTHSAFRGFEIDGRTRDDNPIMAAINSWMVGSSMNSTALRLAGQLVVECAPPGGFLATIKAQKGTAFNPVDGGKDLERITRELALTLNQADHDALRDFRREFRKAILVLDAMFGAAGASTEAAAAAANHLAGAVI